MPSSWSPRARYRLYTNRNTYVQLFAGASGAMEAFEAEVCRRFGIAAAVCVPMARTGLFLTLRESIRPGQKVIMSPLTIVDVVNAVALAGGVPVFADIRRESCAIDPDAAESLIDADTGAILITHLHGESAGAFAFRDIASRRKIRLIEDAAQAFGAVENGKRLGTIGDAGIYSFGFYKNLTTWRGGMVVSNDTGLIRRIREHVRRMRPFSQTGLLKRCLAGLAVDVATWPPVFTNITFPLVRRNIGLLNRMLDPEADAPRLIALPPDWLRQMRNRQAAIGVRNLERVDVDNRVRLGKAARYHAGLEGMEGIACPRMRSDLSHIYTYFPIQVTARAKLLSYAQRRGRDFAAQHLRNCADLPMFAEFSRNCPNARATAAELILLPTYPTYPESEVLKNVDVIRDYVNQSRLTICDK